MSDWHNVSKGEPCPICGKTDWCNLSNDGTVCICHRVESNWPAKSGYGWIHRLKERGSWSPVVGSWSTRGGSRSEGGGSRSEGGGSRSEGGGSWSPVVGSWSEGGGSWSEGRGSWSSVVGSWSPVVGSRSEGGGSREVGGGSREVGGGYQIDFGRVQGGFEGGEKVKVLAGELGVEWKVLNEMGVKYNQVEWCWSFPMYDPEGRVVGLRFRERGGSRKWSARGSKDGLFGGGDNWSLAAGSWSKELMIVEGASDAAALLSLYSQPATLPTLQPTAPTPLIVGRSSCQSGGAMLQELIRKTHPRRATIIADNDEPGIAGAEALGNRLKALLPVRIFVVPHPHKDIRDWYRTGTLTPELLEDVISTQRWV